MLLLSRLTKGQGTFGVFIYNSKLVSVTVERLWLDNQKNISCIPVGIYPLIKCVDDKFGKIFRVNDVPSRDGILIHSANLAIELKGCIAPGLTIGEVGGVQAVLDSKKAMDKLWQLLPEKETLIVVDCFDYELFEKERIDEKI